MSRLPTTNPITLPFGATTAPYTVITPHKGTDFSYLPDDRIYAPFAGRVTQVPNNGNDGNGTYMTLNDIQVGMLHAEKYLVPNGSIVAEGQPIAVMGETGYAFGKHLHLAMKINGVFVDPTKHLTGGNMAADSLTREEIILLYSQQYDVPENQVNLDVVRVFTGKSLGEYLRFVQQDKSYKDHFQDINTPSDAQTKLEQIKAILG